MGVVRTNPSGEERSMRVGTLATIRIAHALSSAIVISGMIAIHYLRSVPLALLLTMSVALGCGGALSLRAAAPRKLRVGYILSVATMASAIIAIHYFDHVPMPLAWMVSVALAVGGSISLILSYRYLRRRINEIKGASALRRTYFWVCAFPLTMSYCLALSIVSLILSVGFFKMGYVTKWIWMP